jgi:glycosyltransferase involved in cell wall biosynthesis
MKLAVLTSHTIQYQTPLFRLLAAQKDIELVVYFFWDFGVKETQDKEFGVGIVWDRPQLEEYSYKFLKNISPHPDSTFWGQINFGIIRELIKGRYDAIFVHGWNSFSNCLGMLTAILTRTPILMHGDNSFMGEMLKPGWKRFLKRIIFGFLFQFPKAFLYMGEEDKKFYEYYGVRPNKLIFMPFACDNKYFFEAKTNINREAERAKRGFGKSTVILFSGKLVPRKRPMDLLLAYEKLQKKYKDLALAFMGDGMLRKNLEKYVEKHAIPSVHFLGFKNFTEMPVYYALADIFVLSSFNEYWGMVINEAMCFGLPVVVSDTTGAIPDLIQEGENGYTYPCGNVDVLAEKLEKLIVDNELRRKFGGKSLEIIKGYSLESDLEGIKQALNYVKQKK